jgi:hypothetical protein
MTRKAKPRAAGATPAPIRLAVIDDEPEVLESWLLHTRRKSDERQVIAVLRKDSLGPSLCAEVESAKADIVLIDVLGLYDKDTNSTPPTVIKACQDLRKAFGKKIQIVLMSRMRWQRLHAQDAPIDITAFLDKEPVSQMLPKIRVIHGGGVLEEPRAVPALERLELSPAHDMLCLADGTCVPLTLEPLHRAFLRYLAYEHTGQSGQQPLTAPRRQPYVVTNPERWLRILDLFSGQSSKTTRTSMERDAVCQWVNRINRAVQRMLGARFKLIKSARVGHAQQVSLHAGVAVTLQ